MKDRYKIVRFYFLGGQRLIKKGLTLEEAREHCRDPETNSRTATGARATIRTRTRGPWFDGFESY